MNLPFVLTPVLIAIAISTPAVVHAGLFGPSNYWECILDVMPGTQNDIVAGTLAMQCQKKFPDMGPIDKKDKVGGLFSVPTTADCIVKYGKNSPSILASRLIYGACYQLYWAESN